MHNAPAPAARFARPLATLVFAWMVAFFAWPVSSAHALGNIPADILNNNDTGVDSLRDVINLANTAGLTTIVEGTYAVNLDGTTVQLTSGPLPTLTGILTLNAAGLPNGITVTGNNWQINTSVLFKGNQTFAINLSGAGSIIQDGAGILTLTGTNSFSGGATISNSGTIAINNNAALGSSIVTLSSSGKLKFLNDMEFSNLIRVNFAGAFDTNGHRVVITRGIENDISAPNSGLIKNGAGTLVLNGVNVYTGLTSLREGNLQIGDATHTNASITSNVIISGGTLSGHGTITGDVMSLGTVSPGGSVGTLTVNGNYTQDTEGSLAITVSPAGASKLAVSGTADLSGALNIVFENGAYTSATHTILTAGTIIGKFETVTIGKAYDATGNALQIDAPLYSANAIQITLRNAAPNAAGNGTNALTSQTINSGHRATDTIFDHLDDGDDTSSQPGSDISFASLADKTITHQENTRDLNDLAKALPTAMKQYNGWFKGIGNIGSVDSNASAAGYENETGGFMFGVDRPMGDGVRVGVAGGYEHTGVTSFSTIASGGEGNTMRFALYGNKAFKDAVSASLQLGYALHMLDSERFVTATASTARASHDAHELSFGGQVSKNIPVGKFIVTPRMGMTYLHVMEDGFTESGAGAFNMSVADNSTDSLRMSAGLGFAAPLKDMNGIAFTPSAHIKYSYEALDAWRSTQGTVGISSVNLQGVAPSRHVVSMGVGLSAKLDDQLDAYGSYDAVLPTGNTFEQTFILGMKFSF